MGASERDRSEADLRSHESTIKYGELAIRSLLIITGGAAVALLAFAGGLKSTHGIEGYASAITWFGIAAALAVLTSGLAYVSQGLYTHNCVKVGAVFQCSAIFAWIISLGLFVWGVLVAADAVAKVQPQQKVPELEQR